MRYLLRTIFVLGFCYLILTTYVLFKIDSALTPVPGHILSQTSSQNNQYLALISYADGDEVFLQNQFSLAASASDKGFDVIYNFRKNHISEEFYNKNKEIFKNHIGAGYWLWKPYFIYKVMQELPEGAIIFYADSGVIFTKPIDRIISLLNDNDMILVGHGTAKPFLSHIKKEALEQFPDLVQKADLNSQNIWAFFMVLKNTQKNRDTILKWLNMCQVKDALTNEPFDPKLQIKSFETHQHDQSLFSLLVATETQGKLIIPRVQLRKMYGVTNFHRHAEDKLTSPLFLQAGVNSIISSIFWNNKLFQYLRKLKQDYSS